ncbi:MAG: hypothetical protein IKD88_06740 [Lachnospiraceae bacterium]|nr:hypothetical protein [Lachnospiraceae bacterium]
MNSRVAFIVAAAFAVCSLLWFERRTPAVGFVCLGVAAIWAVVGIAAVVRDRRRKN